MVKFDSAFFEGRNYLGGFIGFGSEFNNVCIWEGLGLITDKRKSKSYTFNFETYQERYWGDKRALLPKLTEAIIHSNNIMRISPYSIILTSHMKPIIYDLVLKKIIDRCEKRRDYLEFVEIEGLTLTDLVNKYLFGGFRTDAKGHIYLLFQEGFRL